jgi:PAS domain S-box-containing protein
MTCGSASREGSPIDASADETTSNVPPDAELAIETIDLTLLRHLDIPAVVIDRRGRITAINEATESATGLTQECVRDQDFVELFPEDRRVPSYAEFTRVVELGETVEYGSAFERGRERVATRVIVTPLRLGDEIVGALGLAYELRPAESIPTIGRWPTLTPRQYEVLKLLGAALTTNEIAAKLGLSTETVRNHIRAVLTSLGARSRLEAVVAAERLGLIRRRSLEQTDEPDR